MDRRTAIKRGAAGLLALGAAGSGATGAWALRTYGVDGTRERLGQIPERIRTATLSVEQRVRSHFDYLILPEDDLRAYADAHREQFDPGDWDDMFYQRFLLSTDFFPDADESRPVRFVRYYDPYVSPCWNPLAVPGPEPDPAA